MWLFKFIPDILFYFVALASLVVLFISHFFAIIPHRSIVRIVALIVFIISTYLLGMQRANKWWQAEADKLEAKVAELAQRGEQVNEVIKERVVYQTKVVRERGQNVVQYVDREVVKYDTKCEIPKEFVQAHNQAAGVNK